MPLLSALIQLMKYVATGTIIVTPINQGDHLPSIIAGAAIVTFLVAEMLNGIIFHASATAYFSFLVGGAIGYYKIRERADTEPVAGMEMKRLGTQSNNGSVLIHNRRRGYSGERGGTGS